MRITAVIATAALALAGAAIPAVPASADATNYLTSVAATPDAVAPDAMATVDVTVTVGLHATNAIAMCMEEPVDGVSVEMVRAGTTTTGVLDRRWVDLALIAGTRVDGTWQGVWKVGSPWTGTWTMGSVVGCTSLGSGNDFAVEASTLGPAPRVVVAGTHAPTVTVTRVPSVAPYGTPQRITYTYRKSNGAPLAGRKIAIGIDTSCGFYSWGDRDQALNAVGAWSFPGFRSGDDACPMLTTKPTGRVTPDVDGAVLLYLRASNRWTYGVVSRTPSSVMKAVGRSVTITGTVQYRPDWAVPRVAVQRLIGGKWVGISKSNVRANHRYTLTFTPSKKITYTLRVVAFPPEGVVAMVSTPSKAFKVVGV